MRRRVLPILVLSAIATGLAAQAQEKASPPAGAKTESKSAATPKTFKVKFETSKGDFVVQVHREWAPNGADRFHELVKTGFYSEARFFRVVSGFMVQFGIAGDPKVMATWRPKSILDDPLKQGNKRGYVTFAMAGPNTRTTQVFINFKDNSFLDPQGFPAFGQVITGMDVVDKLYSEYGDGAPRGQGPDQGRIQTEGNAYLTKEFPKLDYIKKASIVP